MKYKQTELKPKTCTACPNCKLHICGKERKVQVSSGAAYIEIVPDKRCRFRCTDKVGKVSSINK